MYTWRLFKSCALGSLNHEIARCIGAAWPTSTVGRYSGYCKNRAAGDVTYCHMDRLICNGPEVHNLKQGIKCRNGSKRYRKNKCIILLPMLSTYVQRKRIFFIFFGEFNIFRHFASDRHNQTRTDIYMHNASRVHYQHFGVKQYFGQRCARCMLV